MFFPIIVKVCRYYLSLPLSYIHVHIHIPSLIGTEDRRKGYEIVRKKDQIDQQMITRQNMRIAILLDEIMKFRSKINSYKIESIIELQEMTKESNFFHNAYRETNERFIIGTYVRYISHLTTYATNKLTVARAMCYNITRDKCLSMWYTRRWRFWNKSVARLSSASG